MVTNTAREMLDRPVQPARADSSRHTKHCAREEQDGGTETLGRDMNGRRIRSNVKAARLRGMDSSGVRDMAAPTSAALAGSTEASRPRQ